MEQQVAHAQQQQEQQQEVEEAPGPFPIEQLQARPRILLYLCSRSLFSLLISAHDAFACLQELGIPAADIKKLKDGGVNTVDNLARATKKELCAIKGLSEAKVAKLQTEGEMCLVE